MYRTVSRLLIFVVLPIAMQARALADQPVVEAVFSPQQLVEKLRQGGYTLYFRHAATDHMNDDHHPVDLEDCSTQRNLASEGRADARAIGESIARLGIRIGDVQTSPYCRCRDTAQLAFGRHQPNESLYYAVTAGPEERKKISDALRAMLATTPEAGMNNVIVSHTANLREASGIWPKPEGVAWVLQADGQGGSCVGQGRTG